LRSSLEPPRNACYPRKALLTIFRATRDLSQCGIAIYIKKVSFEGKIRINGNSKYFTMQKYNLQENPLKESRILQDIII
jgi:hypothetical protein